MSNNVFPQLLTGAIAQYPVRKTHLVHTVKNALPDGSLLLFHGGTGSRRIWQLEYIELNDAELEALQSHFFACNGPFRAFTFIDPTDNMFLWSSNLANPVWHTSPLCQVSPGAPDPFGGTSAFSCENNGQSPLGLTQNLSVPANYEYCFSTYVMSPQGATVVVERSGSSVTFSESLPVGPQWNRIVSAGRLDDAGASFSVTVSVLPGEQLCLYGPQLEAQLAPSRYRATEAQAGVYSDAHWVTDHLPVVATAPNQFSTLVSIEAYL